MERGADARPGDDPDPGALASAWHQQSWTGRWIRLLHGGHLTGLLCQNGNVYDLNELIPATSGWLLQEVDASTIAARSWGTGRILPGKSTPFCFIPSRDTVARSRLETIPKVWRGRMQPGLHYRRASAGVLEGIGHTVLRAVPTHNADHRGRRLASRSFRARNPRSSQGYRIV